MMRYVIAGGAGFLGSHLADALIQRGDQIVVLDNLSSGRLENIQNIIDSGHKFINCDVSREVPVEGAVDVVCNFASLASPPQYLAEPLKTLEVGSEGTRRLLELALLNNAKFLMASTSEIYGDPLIHPQPESYWGNVNPIGVRSVYDEAKRFSEALTFAYQRSKGLNTSVVRIFNTYGPRLNPTDGRVISNLVRQALDGDPMTVFGDGRQTRSFCYVDDEIRGILALLDSDHSGPMNIGNPDEFTILELVDLVIEITGTTSKVNFEPLPVDDPAKRKPDITLAREHLSWHPQINLKEGLTRFIKFEQERRAGKQ